MWIAQRPGRSKKFLSVQLYLAVFLLVFSIKLALFFLVVFLKSFDLASVLNLGGGNDGDYYDAFAKGEVEVVTSAWPVLLRWLNQWNLYSREGVAFTLFLLSSLAVPLLAGTLAVGGFMRGRAAFRTARIVALIASLYPTMTFYGFDIYRDIFMLFVFLLGMLALQKAFHSYSFIGKSVWLVVYFLIGWVLFSFRPYLGFAVVVALPLTKVLAHYRLSWSSASLSALLYLAALYIGHHFGAFAPLLEYRERVFVEGGSTFYLSLSVSGPQFLVMYILSFIFQIFGLYLNTWKALLLFFVESLPFTIAIFDIWKRRYFLDSFSKYLLAFSLIYATIFVLGNDNLGSAARLRMFVYVSVLIVWARLSLAHTFYSWRRSGGVRT